VRGLSLLMSPSDATFDEAVHAPRDAPLFFNSIRCCPEPDIVLEVCKITIEGYLNSGTRPLSVDV
jgi:hypothetical protein